LIIDGVTYSRGVGTHAPASGVGTIDYAIGGATTFKATIGVNDYQAGTFGSVILRAYVDGILRYTSPTLTSISAPIDIAVDTTGGATLRLEVDNANGSNGADHATWYNARLEGGSIGLSIAESASNNAVVGSVNRTDADWGDNATYTLVDNAGGRFAVASGTGLITVANSSLLNYEANASHTIVIRATDVAGLTYDKTMTVSVTDVNETPTAVADTATAIEAGGVSNGTAGTNPTGNVLTNDTDVDAGDIKTVSGVLAGVQASAAANVGSAVTGTYGSINIAADGTYTYNVDNNNATVQALRTTANTLTDVFTYTMRDTAGLTSTTQITVTIQGANDAPVATIDNVTAVEGGGTNNSTSGVNPTGNVLTNDTDVDSGDTKTVTGVVAGTPGSASGSVDTGVVGTYGTIRIAANGAYTYFVDNTNATVQALANSSQTIIDVFTYTMTDAAGATSTACVSVTIQGNNDAPVFGTTSTSPTLTLSAGTATGNQAFTGTLGLEFNTTQDIVISQLGAFDDGSDGFLTSKTVTLYNADTQAIIAQATIPAGTSSSLVNGYRYVTLGAPVTLGAGFHGIIAAIGFSASDQNYNSSGLPSLLTLPSGNGVVFTSSSFYSTSGFPTTLDPGQGRYGAGSFLIASPSTDVSLSVSENTSGTVHTAVATDVDTGATITYSLGGVDAALVYGMNSSTGAVAFASAPNFEVRQRLRSRQRLQRQCDRVGRISQQYSFHRDHGNGRQ
jgi:VCBS repeat-containing protein